MYTFSDEEACLYAEISPRTLYNYQKKYPVFLQIKQQLRLHPNMNAKKVLVDRIKDNIDQAKWWAKNHKSMRADFGELQEIKSTVPLLEGPENDSEADALTRKYNEDLRALYARGPEQESKKDANYVQVLGTVECGACHPEKFPDCKKVEKETPGWKCDCKCHKQKGDKPKPKQNASKQDTQVAKGK